MFGKSMITAIFLFAALSVAYSSGNAQITILTPKESSNVEAFAAQEMMRYIYQRTGNISAITFESNQRYKQTIVICRKDWPMLPELLDSKTLSNARTLKPQEYILKTVSYPDKRRSIFIIGGDNTGVLYGSYRYIEHMGVRFYLHGDVVPDKKIVDAFIPVNESGKPLFDIRGIQPFHDFFEGPDWWNTDDYESYINQLAKMRMNFIGLHNYPLIEPTVWVGLPEDHNENGDVKNSYPAHFASTARTGWGNVPMKTSEYAGGAADLFESDDHGPDVQKGSFPLPANQQDSDLLFTKTAEMYKRVFTLARNLGVKTCVGTETPLVIPGNVRQKLIDRGLDPSSREAVSLVYKGIFERIAKAYPIDYYWVWIPEVWTWSGNTPEQYTAVENDVNAALDAIKSSGADFDLATCGWVLGPIQDRAALDKILPPESPMSCISRNVGHDPIEPGFANISGRPKWAIPWMENDPMLTVPQPWVGRMRYDAVDSLKYGCTGLLGIHWRTKAMEMNVSALALAGWDQSWKPKVAIKKQKKTDGVVGGDIVTFTAPVAGTSEQPVYQTVRYAVNSYNLQIPNGNYSVILKFNEPHYTKSGARVFGAKLQDNTVIDSLDIFAQAGQNKALDYKFDNIRVDDGWLSIDFTFQIEFPCIAGIVVDGIPDSETASGKRFTRKINCGGKAYLDYEADDNPGLINSAKGRTMPITDFYLDYAKANFGDSVAVEIDKMFEKLDGINMPSPVTWTTGPGVVVTNNQPWTEVSKQYDFIHDLESIRRKIIGKGNLRRFDYWLDTFRSIRALAEFGCLAGELDRTMDMAVKQTDSDKQKSLIDTIILPLRGRMAELWTEAIRKQVSTVSTPGEMGTIANLEQQSRKANKILTKHDETIEKIIGAKLSSAMMPSGKYIGTAKIIAPTVKTHIDIGKSLRLKIMIIGQTPNNELPTGDLLWREIGQKAYKSIPLKHISRRVFEAELPAQSDTSIIEYYIKAKCGIKKLVYPATAPELNQTITVADLVSNR